jgi:glutamate synthase (NADPH/NADH) small chain
MERLRRVNERIKDHDEIYLPIDTNDFLKETKKCVKCNSTPSCRKFCPLDSKIDLWIDLASKGDYKEAFNQLNKEIPFPEFTGRICDAPCEPACIISKDNYPLNIRAIEKHLADLAIKNDWIKPQISKTKINKKIVVIGSGPAGLSCANELNRKGYEVEVIEKEEKFGGLLRYGIPEFRLPKKYLDFRIQLMKQEGVQFFRSKIIQTEEDIRKLKNNFDAIIICCGASMPRDLPVMGRGLKGINLVLDYLKFYHQFLDSPSSFQTDELNPRNKNVIVISSKVAGWIGSITRLKPKSLNVLNILPKGEKIDFNNNPNFPNPHSGFKNSPFYNEGMKLNFSTTVKEFIGNNYNQVIGVKTAKVIWESNNNDISCLKEIPNSEEILPCDLIIISLGFIGASIEFLSKFEIGIDEKCRADVNDFQAIEEKIFVAGDIRMGQSIVAKAIKDGIEVAKRVNEYLQK